MILADTPKDWPNGPSISDLHVVLLFAGVPLLVIVVVSLAILGPSWARGPRYRPGQPWDQANEWFGSSVGLEPPPPEPTPGDPPGAGGLGRDGGVGGASAGW